MTDRRADRAGTPGCSDHGPLAPLAAACEREDRHGATPQDTRQRAGRAGGSGRDGHTHGTPASDQRLLWLAFGIIAAFMAAEIAIALISGSLALIADAGQIGRAHV